MLLILTLGILGLAVAAWRKGGPLLTMALAWLVCLLPLAIGLIEYKYLIYDSDRYVWIIALSIAAFLIGTVGAAVSHPAPAVGPQRDHDWVRDFNQWLPVAKFCLVVSMIAILCMALNIVTLGLDFSNLGAVRENLIRAESATLAARIASVAVWACYFCFAFALYFRHRLDLQSFLVFISAGSGIFLSALMQAGRGSVFLIILLTLFLENIRARRIPVKSNRGFAPKMAIFGVCAAFVIFVTMSRTSGFAGYNDRAHLLLTLFDARLNPVVDTILSSTSIGFRDFFVEALIYVSHPVPMFSLFLGIDFGPLYWGIHDFPFFFRQIEPITGTSVIEAYRIKTLYMSTEGVIGVGWITSLHTLLLDFGTFGLFVFMCAQGFASQWAWASVRRGHGFGSVFFCVLFMTAAVHLPYYPMSSDTNMFLLMIFLAVTMTFKRWGPSS